MCLGCCHGEVYVCQLGAHACAPPPTPKAGEVGSAGSAELIIAGQKT